MHADIAQENNLTHTK